MVEAVLFGVVTVGQLGFGLWMGEERGRMMDGRWRKREKEEGRKEGEKERRKSTRTCDPGNACKSKLILIPYFRAQFIAFRKYLHPSTHHVVSKLFPSSSRVEIEKASDGKGRKGREREGKRERKTYFQETPSKNGSPG